MELPPEISEITSLRRLCVGIGFNSGSLIVGTCSEMKHLALSYKMNNDLPQEIQNMKNLQSFMLVYKGVNLPNWICEFQQLERLELLECSEVEELPSLERLPNLKILKLHWCERVKDLGIGSSGDPGGFPMLEILVLKHMNQLQSLTGPSCEGGMLKEGTLPKLRVLKISRCPALKKLPMGIEKLPGLIALYGGERWWKSIIWEDNNIKIHVGKVFKTKKEYDYPYVVYEM